MGRFDIRPAGERATRHAPLETRTGRLMAHTTPKAVTCACITKFPAECLCCGKTLCLLCAGVIRRNTDLMEYLQTRNEDFNGEFAFNDSIEGI